MRDEEAPKSGVYVGRFYLI